MSQEQLLINGELLRLSREARGWVLNDMATRACMSVKQIRQLEEGGMSSFYSEAVKMTAAKKVGALLGLSAESVLAKEINVPHVETLESDVPVEPEIEAAAVAAEPAEPAAIDVVHDPIDQSSVSSADLVEDSKSKTSLWIIAGLFAAALAVAAYMQPQDEQSSEPIPPLQVVPSEATDAASAASASEVLTQPGESAASSALAASSVAPSLVRVASPAIVAASAASAAASK